MIVLGLSFGIKQIKKKKKLFLTVILLKIFFYLI